MTDDVLRDYYEKRMELWAEALQSADLTVGIEHEFFLYTAAGSPASHKDSQRFFQTLETEGWGSVILTEKRLDTYVGACKKTYATGQLTVKYEHHPHLLELVLPPVKNLWKYSELWQRIWSDFERVCKKLQMNPCCEPQCRVDTADDRLFSVAEVPTRLRAYRRRQARNLGVSLSRSAENFSAGLAATQVHIGGLPWMVQSSIVSKLYRIEPLALSAELQLTPTDEDPQNEVNQRWAAYQSGLAGTLLGVPHLLEWTVDAWFGALLDAPHLYIPIPEDPKSFLDSVRDNQVIKPRVFGTLEFRSAPARRTRQEVLALAAFRLGICACLLEREDDLPLWMSYPEAYCQWWEIVNEERYAPNTDEILRAARIGLDLRAAGEAELLDLFSTR